MFLNTSHPAPGGYDLNRYRRLGPIGGSGPALARTARREPTPPPLRKDAGETTPRPGAQGEVGRRKSRSYSESDAGSLVMVTPRPQFREVRMDWQKQLDRQRIFVMFEGERKVFEVSSAETVRELTERVREAFLIGPDNGPAGLEEDDDQTVLTLTYSGAHLHGQWCISDLGIPNGMTLKAILKQESKPSVYIYCAFNEETVPIVDKMNLLTTPVSVLRGMVSRVVGVPVTIFRLSTGDNRELFDTNVLGDYGLNPRDTLRLDVWDGWKEFINLCIMGFSKHVMAHLPRDDLNARFYMKVAMYIAAHFGHVDLAVTLLKQGIRADEPVGEHPMRQWCKDSVLHVDARKAPVHEAAEAGSLAVLRSFVHSNLCNVLAKDGNGLNPLNLALRRKQKPCASFLLTKQWSKITYTKKNSVPLSIFVKMKRWGERAKDKVLVIHGQWKSSIKNPKKHMQIGALLGQGVLLDGFSRPRLTTLPEKEALRLQQEEDERRERLYANPIPPPVEPDTYFRSVKMMQENMKLPRLNRFNKMMQKAGQGKEQEEDTASHAPESARDDPAKEQAATATVARQDSAGDAAAVDTRAHRPRSNSHGGYRRHLPPITDKKAVSQSQQNLSTVSVDDPEFRRQNSKKKPYDKGSDENKENRKVKKVLTKPTDGGGGRNTNRGGGDTESTKSSPRKSSKEAALIAKMKTEGGSLPLPMQSPDDVPRPFIKARSEKLTKGTLSLYEKYRGIGSRDYAIKCLTAANGFSDKPWLQQVQQALVMSQQGIKKAVRREPHMFTPREGDIAEEARGSEAGSLSSRA